MTNNKLLIAIDGPAASGKGTIAKLLGEKLALPVLHTGNIYRAIAYKIILAKQDPHNKENVISIAKQLVASDLNNPNLNQEEVGNYASIISSDPKLRDVTYGFQRNFIGQSSGAIIEGRDIGTVICPEAQFKFYITADAEVRAKRRYDQQPGSNYNIILEELKTRDQRDQNRIIAPLKPAQDAIIIDSSQLNAQETLASILSFIP
jgi:cytidylate kinase